MKSLTLSERLAETYKLPTIGMGTARYRLIYAPDAHTRSLTPEEMRALNARVTHLRVGLFGSDLFSTRDGRVVACKVCPQLGGSGWSRNPIADHWLVTRDGKEVFRTQNYPFVLRYFQRVAT